MATALLPTPKPDFNSDRTTRRRSSTSSGSSECSFTMGNRHSTPPSRNNPVSLISILKSYSSKKLCNLSKATNNLLPQQQDSILLFDRTRVKLGVNIPEAYERPLKLLNILSMSFMFVVPYAVPSRSTL